MSVDESAVIFEDSISWAKDMIERIRIASEQAKDISSLYALNRLWNLVISVRSTAEHNLNVVRRTEIQHER